ncbi:MAG: FAD:protein FMN transferase [Coriobacteriia bacterium]|nr:FAD:protein FMN transferase [Coriobacteriia bacterium]
MRAVLTAVVAVSIALTATGCTGVAEPFRSSRQVLGTAVTITAYADPAREAAPRAFRDMAALESALSPYDASSSVSTFNRDPYVARVLPAAATTILEAVKRLGVQREFSPALFRLTALYDFGGRGSVPSTMALDDAVRAASGFRERPSGAVVFVRPAGPAASASPGLDFGGAAKGLALDRAASILGAGPWLITAGSSTLAYGSKPDGEPWRVGIEDPREPGRVIATVSADGTLSVSTSGDYQQYFERAGIRYHHILDPSTGRPASGLRSLTVFGRMAGLDADILSTALFVMGRDRALEYARAHAIGVFIVDDRGRVTSNIPSGSGEPILETQRAPTR